MCFYIQADWNTIFELPMDDSVPLNDHGSSDDVIKFYNENAGLYDGDVESIGYNGAGQVAAAINRNLKGERNYKLAFYWYIIIIIFIF